MKRKKRNFFIYDFIKITGAIPAMLLLGPRVKYPFGRKNTSLKGSVLIVSNHSSYLDPITLMLSFPFRRVFFVATKELFATPLGKWFFKNVHCVEIDRENFTPSAFGEITGLLKENHVLSIFPEGFVHPGDASVKPFKSGAALMAIRGNASVVPVYIGPKKHWYTHPVVVVGKNIYPKELGMEIPTRTNIDRITSRLYNSEQVLKNFLHADNGHLSCRQEEKMTIKADNHSFDKYTDIASLAKIKVYRNVTAMWENCMKHYADKPAVSDIENLTYGQIDSKVASFRGVLAENGVKEGDFVGMQIPNSADFVKSYLAITTLGAVAVLLPPQLDAKTVFGCSMMCGPKFKALVYSEETKQNTEIVKSQKPDVPLIAVSSEGTAVPAVDVEPEVPCCVVFTGGTTGRSKGVLLSHLAVMTGARNGCYGCHDIFGEKYFLVLPLTHVFGLIRNLMTCLLTGSSIFICRNTQDMFKQIPVFKPTIMVLVPALAELALNISKQFGKNMLGPDLKYIICGAAVVSPYLVKEYAAMGISLFPGYGLTESANLVSGNPESAKKPEAVGYLYPDMQVRIENGELWLKGPNMLTCYIGNPEENEAAFSDGWFKTGDLVRFDEEGMLYITGRTKEIIVLPNGENVSPAEIETRFNEIDAVQDSLVYEENGKLVLEVFPRSVILKKNGITDTEGYLKKEIDRVNAKLLPYQRISKIVIRDKDFVRSPSMKILRNGQK